MTDAAPDWAEPGDLEQFWRGRWAASRGEELRLTRRPGERAGLERVEFTSAGGARIGAWLQLPPTHPTSAMIVGHGYAGRDSPEPCWAPEGAAVLYPVARGLPTISLDPRIPPDGQQHVIHGIEDRDSYVLAGCAADLVWRALDALQELLGEPLGTSRGGLRTTYQGTSFGGGIGALAAPWDDRLDAVALHLPTFGDHPRRLAEPSVGSSAALSGWVASHPEVWEVLGYFDAAFTARRLSVPTLVSPARVDPAVPPIGQWAIAHAVPQRWARILPVATGHMDDDPAEMAKLQALTRQLAGETGSGRQVGWRV